jgi:hypothetical protein
VDFSKKWEGISKNWGIGVVYLKICPKSEDGDWRRGTGMKP